MSSTVRTPPPTVTGMKQASAVCADHVEDDAAVLVARRDVEEGELVGTGGVIGDRRLDRIAGIAQVDEVHALDDPAVLDVEAGNDADLEHRLRIPCGLVKNGRLINGGSLPRRGSPGAGRSAIIGSKSSGEPAGRNAKRSGIVEHREIASLDRDLP